RAREVEGRSTWSVGSIESRMCGRERGPIPRMDPQGEIRSGTGHGSSFVHNAASVRTPPLSTPSPERSPTPSAELHTAAAAFTPCLRLQSKPVLVDQSGGLGEDYREVETAVLHLAFDYGGVMVPAGDPRDLIEVPGGDQ